MCQCFHRATTLQLAPISKHCNNNYNLGFHRLCWSWSCSGVLITLKTCLVLQYQNYPDEHKYVWLTVNVIIYCFSKDMISGFRRAFLSCATIDGHGRLQVGSLQTSTVWFGCWKGLILLGVSRDSAGKSSQNKRVRGRKSDRQWRAKQVTDSPEAPGLMLFQTQEPSDKMESPLPVITVLYTHTLHTTHTSQLSLLTGRSLHLFLSLTHTHTHIHK